MANYQFAIGILFCSQFIKVKINMPNFKKHIATGAAVRCSFAVIRNVIMQREKMIAGQQDSFDWNKLAKSGSLGLLVGAVGGILPDILEPAQNPHHRKSFHSIAAAVVLAKILYKVDKAPGRHPDNRDGIHCGGLGYLSHLALDMLTPMSLRLI